MVDSVVGSVAGSVVGAVVAAVVGAVVAAVVEVVASVGSAGVLQAHRRRQNISNKGRIRFMLKDPFLKISVIIANLRKGCNRQILAAILSVHLPWFCPESSRTHCPGRGSGH